MKSEDAPNETPQSDAVPTDGNNPVIDNQPLVFGRISSRLIRQWIMEGKAEYEQQRAQAAQQGEADSEATK